MQTIKIKLTDPNAVMPQRANATDAAFDVVAVSRQINHGYVTYGLGIASEIPAGWEAKIYPRSSISNYDLVLCNGVGIIDSEFRGQWSARFSLLPNFNQGLEESGVFNPEKLTGDHFMPRLYEVGDKIAQVQFQRVPEVRLEQVDELASSARGKGGFGSTGK